MAGFSPQLPLTYSSTDGFYTLNTSLREVVKQNLKMLLLTAPGERMMFPDFGVGVRNALFENPSEAISFLQDRIVYQVKRFIPYITIIKLQFLNLNQNQEAVIISQDLHTLGLRIEYFIRNISLKDSLLITNFQKNEFAGQL